MARSLKKGPYVHFKLEKKVLANAAASKKSVIKTWSRASMITPDFVGQTIAVHKLGEFALTRTYRGHGGKKDKGKR